MNFMKIKVKQQEDGKPGFMDIEEFEVNINPENITLFNKSDEDPSITFVRMACGATLIVSMKTSVFANKLKKFV